MNATLDSLPHTEEVVRDVHGLPTHPTIDESL